MSCAVTVYGTVASEMGYMGVPTIACGANPHMTFDFCRTARTKEEYRRLLLEAQACTVDAQNLKEESCAFHYMHNLHLDEEQLSVRDKLVEAVSYLWFPKETPTRNGLDARMRALTADSGFDRFLDKLMAALDGKSDF